MLSTGGATGWTSEKGKDDAKRYSHGIDIYQYEMNLVAVWNNKHWSIIAIDTVKKPIRFLTQYMKETAKYSYGKTMVTGTMGETLHRTTTGMADAATYTRNDTEPA